MATAQPRNANSQPDFPTSPTQPRKKGRFWKAVGLLALLSIGTGFGLAKFTTQGQQTTAMIERFYRPVQAARENPNLLFDKVVTPDGHVNLLVIGQDRNWKQGKVFDPTIGKFRPHQVIDLDTRPRADSMILVSFDKASRQVRLLSIPRDTRVRYRDLTGRKHALGKLNAVYAEPDGDTLLPKVIEDELGVRVDRTAVIKLDGFTKLIEAVGGLDINVEGALFNGKRTRMKYKDNWGGWSVDLMPGMQHLDGEQAHGYVRYRKDNESDPGRVRRQQQVMRALAKKMMNVGYTKLPGFITEFQKQFTTTMSDEELVSAAMFARGLNDSSKVTPLTPYGILAPDGGDIILNRPQNTKLFAAIFGASFNPKKLLVLSPETKGDDFGARNNNNPAAIPILREAGLLEAEKHRDGALEAPGLQ